MKILNAQQMRDLDQYTIDHTPISSIELMERASTVFVDKLNERFPEHRSFYILCGKGNNGGDGLVVARLLDDFGFQVRVIIIEHSNKCSSDHAHNFQRLNELGRVDITTISEAAKLPAPKPEDLVIDAMLGSGLQRPLEGLLLEAVENVNSWKNVIVSVDIPTGLFSEFNVENNRKGIIEADHCITFHAPKLAFLLPDNGRYVGSFDVVDIGLKREGETDSPWEFVMGEEVKHLIRSRERFSHKGSFGHALLVVGSIGKIGAAIMSGRAVLRSGAGLLTIRNPKCGLTPLQTALPEAMCFSDPSEGFLSEAFRPTGYSAIGVGPGIGTHNDTSQVLKMIIQDTTAPLVLDADALNILSENPTWLQFLPHNTILTPHPREFDRLAGNSKTSEERLEKQKELARKTHCVIVLKGAHTSIALPDGKLFFNSTGNPGMASAGSGDVLTGIITGILAQGHHPTHSAIIGVYVHGLSGDIAADILGQTSLLATDIIEHLPEAFLLLENRS